MTFTENRHDIPVYPDMDLLNMTRTVPLFPRSWLSAKKSMVCKLLRKKSNKTHINILSIAQKYSGSSPSRMYSCWASAKSSLTTLQFTRPIGIGGRNKAVSSQACSHLSGTMARSPLGKFSLCLWHRNSAADNIRKEPNFGRPIWETNLADYKLSSAAYFVPAG